MENRKIKRVTKSEILDEASEKGEILAATAQKSLSETLSAKIQESGLVPAIEHCNVVAQPLVDSLSMAYGATIRRVSSKLRNPVDKPDQIEQEILEAYEYAMENSVSLESNVQEVGDQEILFTKPILISNPLCLNCHGTIGKEILDENYDAIKSLYPQDSAVGYNLGDLRGMWSIRFQKKELIMKMD